MLHFDWKESDYIEEEINTNTDISISYTKCQVPQEFSAVWSYMIFQPILPQPNLT
jgi:hypothetical protein